MPEATSQPRLDQGAIDALRTALHDATSWSQVRSGLTAYEDQNEMIPWRALAFAFGFALIEYSRTDWREREQSPFGAMVEWQGGARFPAALRDVEHVDLEVWQQALDAVGAERYARQTAPGSSTAQFSATKINIPGSRADTSPGVAS
jgi:hypothetical protein